MRLTEILTEGVAGPKKCWPGHRKVGTQPGTGKNAGKRVNDCEKIKEDEVEESGLQYYTGVKKHGKEYMKKAAAAGREGASQKELGALKDKYSKAHKNEGVVEGDLEANTPNPVVVIQDLKGKILDKVNLSVAAQKYKLGNPQDIKKQLAHQNYTTIGNYVVVAPMTGQPQDATTQGMAEAEKKGLYYYVNKRKKAGTSRDASHPKAPTAQAWKDAAKTAKKEDLELEQEFNMIEEVIEYIADQHAVDAELVWEDLSTLTDDELYVFAVTQPVNEDWQKANKRDKTDGMSRKAVKAYRRENPGSKLKTAVTTKPSKLKKGGKASKRRKSYCSRSRGQMKMHSISCAKTPDKAICKARRRWNC
jgi:hypothetical protein